MENLLNHFRIALKAVLKIALKTVVKIILRFTLMDAHLGYKYILCSERCISLSNLITKEEIYFGTILKSFLYYMFA